MTLLGNPTRKRGLKRIFLAYASGYQVFKQYFLSLPIFSTNGTRPLGSIWDSGLSDLKLDRIAWCAVKREKQDAAFRWLSQRSRRQFQLAALTMSVRNLECH